MYNCCRRQLRVLPLGDGSYQRFWGNRMTTHETRDGFQSPKTLWVGRWWIRNEVRGEGFGFSLSSSDDPPLPTGAGGCVNRSYRVQKVLRTIPVSTDNRQKKTDWVVVNKVDGVFPGRPQSLRHQRRPVDDCSPGRGGMAQDGGTRQGMFHGEMERCRESQGWTTACSSMPERDGKDQGEDSPKQAGSCWFARSS